MHCVGNRNPNENVQSTIIRTVLIFSYVNSFRVVVHILFQVKDVPQKIWNLCGTPKLHFNQVVQWEFFSKFLVVVYM